MTLFLRNLFKRIREKSEDKNPSNEYVLAPLHMAGIQLSDQHYFNIHELTFQMSESTANIFATIHTGVNLGGYSFQSEFGG